MSDTPAQRSQPWLALLAFGLLWGVILRQFSPHWSLFPQYNYGWGVPFMCAYLLWERWLTRPTPDTPDSRWPVVLASAATVILFLGRVVQEANTTWRLSSWAMAFCAIAITLCGIYLAGGKKWLRYFSFPVCFFLVAVPWPTGLENVVVQNLTQLNVGATVETLTWWGIPAMQQGNVIEISTGIVGIDEACSGIRSLQATLMISLFLGELYRFTVIRRFALVLAGMGLAFLFNVGRTFLLVYVAARDGIGAIARWHDPAGVTILVACFTALWGLGFLLRDKTASPAKLASPPLARPLARNFLLFLAVAMIVTELGTELWYRAHESTTLASQPWQVHWPQEKSRFGFTKISKEVHDIMKFDEGQSARWVNADGSTWQTFYFRWLPARSLKQRVIVQAAKGHRPEICLRATGMTLREDYGVRWIKIGRLQFPFHRYRFEEGGQSIYVFYSVWEDGIREQSQANMRENTAARLAAALAGTRGLGERILELGVGGVTDEAQAEAALERQLAELIRE